MIKPLRLANVAAKAQGIVLRQQLASIARRAAFGVVAATFALGALVIVHIMSFMALRQYGQFQPIPASAILLVVDLVFAAIFGIMASSAKADPILQEAIRMRDQSLDQARQSLTLASMAAPLTRLVADTGLLRLLMSLIRVVFRRSSKR